MAHQQDLPDEEYEDDDSCDDEENWDENELPAHGRDASFRGASPIIMMLLVWGLGFWVAWSMAIGFGWTQDTHLRTGTMTVTSCHRSVLHAFVVFACSGPTRFAPEETWAPGAVRHLRGREVTVLSRTRLSGDVDFFTYDPRGSERSALEMRTLAEVGAPLDQEVKSPTGATLWPPLATGLGAFVGGLVVAIVVGKVLAMSG